MSLTNRSRRGFLRAGGIGVMGALASRGITQASQAKHSHTLYVGTYTSGKSEGIYIYLMNVSSGEL